MDMSRRNTKAYYALIESFIPDQEQIWSDQAIDIADSISGLHVSGSEDIWVNGNERRIAGRLAETYIETFGRATGSSLQDVAQVYQSDVELPAVLQS